MPQKRGSKDPPLQRPSQMFQQIWFGEFALFAGGEGFQDPIAARDFIVAEDEGVLGAKLDGAPEGYAEFLFDGGQFDTEARVAQSFGGAQGGGVGALAHAGDIQRWRVASGEWRVNTVLTITLLDFLQREEQAVFADGEADAFGRSAAEKLDEPVVAAAAADGVLGAEAGSCDLEGGAHVVVEAADEAPIFLIFDGA